MTVHDFKEQLSYSKHKTHEPFWGAAYYAMFPDMIDMSYVTRQETQRKGKDRHVMLADHTITSVEEKKRKKWYGDILVEFISNDASEAPGWVHTIEADWLAYAIMPKKRVYFIDAQELKEAWKTNRETWKSIGGEREAKNGWYSTWSCPVSIESLKSAGVTVVEINV